MFSHIFINYDDGKLLYKSRPELKDEFMSRVPDGKITIKTDYEGATYEEYDDYVIEFDNDTEVECEKVVEMSALVLINGEEYKEVDLYIVLIDGTWYAVDDF